jgi:ATP-binding cassette subfamily F protein 3
VGQLSGGERARLSLALITRDAPHILILDEPTNHLDVDAREALVQALAEFGGAVVVVSHDRHLVGLIADRLVLVADGTVTEFDGSLDDYRDQILSSGAAKGGNGSSAKRGNRKEERRQAAAARERNKTLRKAVVQAEAEMKRLWQKREEIDGLLAAPEATGTSASDLMRKRGDLERNLTAAEADWMKATELAESASGESAEG